MYRCLFVYIPQENLHITPQNITLQFYIYCCKNYYATWNQAWNRPITKSFVRDGYPISIMSYILIEHSGNLQHPKNVKSISNTTVSHLVSCRVISRPATMKG